MARLRDAHSVDRDEDSTVLRNSSRAPSSRPRQSHTTPGSASQSPSPSVGSDKENRSRQPTKDRSMPPPPLPNANKRRRTGERPESLNDQDTTTEASRPTSRTPSITSVAPTSSREPSVATYDPHQSIHERQSLRKGLRDLNFQVLDNRNEWLTPGSNGLFNAITNANNLSKRVKQTSDATIDSRFLVNAGDLAYKKTQAASVGDGTQGIDVDDFVTKCIAFMRRGDEEAAQVGQGAGTQRTQPQAHRRRPARTQTEIDSDEEDLNAAGDAFNWAYLGSHAAFPATCRPPAPSFLLGPLSVQKKARTQTQRRARQARVDPAEAVKPRELQVGDLQRQEDSSLTSMCKKIQAQLGSLVNEAERADEAGLDEEVMDEICERNKVCDNGGISLFHFAFNPKSFGQTVENLFYVSFLIKEGTVGVHFDGEGKPTLNPVTANATADSGPSASKKFQSVLSIDFNDWQAACEAFKIEESLIKNRVVPPGEGDAGAGAKESEGEESGEDGEERDGGRGRVGRSAWYG